MSTLQVALLQADPALERLSGAERVAARSAHARSALALAAQHTGAALGPLTKGEHDAPRPSNGWHWSISHARGLSAGVVARAPVGVDVEAIAPRRQETVRRAAAREELELLGGFTWESFFRLWTAKEAVLKKAGCGILELARCRLVAAPAPDVLVLEHRGSAHETRLCVWQGHAAAVSCDAAFEVAWALHAGEEQVT
ncbi:MAG: 4'-phosphopantetheinyl transferase superfamily protein [Planctomycetes bacterium]|nr:4'-phosphopantetheinyl transferase superfamily protein [Planctomycetota bacterium]